MPVPYYRYVTTREATPFPLWSTIWKGSDGCPDRTVYFGAPNTPSQPPAPGTVQYYEPEVVTRISQSGARNNGRTGGSPPYRYTYRYVGKTVVKNHLLQVHLGVNGKQEWFQWGSVPKVGQTCTPTESKRDKSGLNYATFDDQGHNFSSYDVYESSYISQGEISDAITEVRNAVMEDAMTSYDFLTDLTQVSDIPRSLRQITGDLTKILRTLKSRHSRDVLRAAARLSPRSLLRKANKALRNFGEEWMNYRYGIMPLLYSYQDIMKTLDRGQSVKTKKMKVITPTLTGAALPAATAYYTRKTVEGSVIVRASVFQHFTSAEVAKLSGVGVNPFVTAWELIPYSFVFDWFVDVGTYIASRTNQTWANKRHACLSIRSNYTTKYELHRPVISNTYTMTNITPTNWWGSGPPAEPPVVITNPEGYYLFKEEVVDTYRRMLIPTTSAPPTFTPSLNWRRYVDAAVMSLTNLGRLIGALKR